jgi:pSer/pThr/pTyr-binding forkhead associated (FHA) protein
MIFRWFYQGNESSLSVEKPEIFVGRPNPYLGTDVNLSPDITVSRTHARVWLEEGQWWIEDLASKYGTLINGQRIETKHRLQPGDQIRLGETDLQITL